MADPAPLPAVSVVVRRLAMPLQQWSYAPSSSAAFELGRVNDCFVWPVAWITEPTFLAKLDNMNAAHAVDCVTPIGHLHNVSLSMMLARDLGIRPFALLRRQPWPESSAIASRLESSQPIEEENSPYYHPGCFYPAQLGEVLGGRYQIATKLGYGSGSTVWLARDLLQFCLPRPSGLALTDELNRWRWVRERYVAVKIGSTSEYAQRKGVEAELATLKRISHAQTQHEGWHFVRKLVDSFTIESANAQHVCLAFEPLREPLFLHRRRFIGDVIPPEVLKVIVQMILHGLDYLHSECQIIHTGTFVRSKT